MKKFQILILLLIANFIFAQNKQFFYEHKYIPDSTETQNIKTEMMVLTINKDKSEFYGQEKFQEDSTFYASANKSVGLAPPPPRKISYSFSDRIVKNLNAENLEFFTKVFRSDYLVSQDVKLKWNLTDEFQTILGYAAQKATTDFGGRHWTAWFTKEIPFQDGPYKFSGLPGLILKIHDANNEHSFEIKAIKNSKADFIYPTLIGSKPVKISHPQYLKIYKEYRQNPAGNLTEAVPDYTDQNGKLVSQQELRKDIKKRAEERIIKDNNILEMDLLK